MRKEKDNTKDNAKEKENKTWMAMFLSYFISFFILGEFCTKIQWIGRSFATGHSGNQSPAVGSRLAANPTKGNKKSFHYFDVVWIRFKSFLKIDGPDGLFHLWF